MSVLCSHIWIRVCKNSKSGRHPVEVISLDFLSGLSGKVSDLKWLFLRFHCTADVKEVHGTLCTGCFDLSLKLVRHDGLCPI